jgi:hypothetical protein
VLGNVEHLPDGRGLLLLLRAEAEVVYNVGYARAMLQAALTL